MKLSRHIVVVFAFFAITSAFLLRVDTAMSSTTKVQTKTIIVPEESSDTKAKEEQVPASDDEGLIPTDALPKTEKNEAPVPKSSSDEEPKNEETIEPEQADIGPPPEVQRDLGRLPEPVRRIRELILKAAKTGDVEKLRGLIATGDTPTTFSISGTDGDPISFLKEASGDDEGFEILAILIEVLEAGYVHLDAGTDNEVYVWPYFFAWPLEKLTPPMRVELFRILTAGDVQDSTDFGGYIFYRVGIRPDGHWDFFVAGD